MLKTIFLELVGKYTKDHGFLIQLWDEINNLYTSKKRYYHNLSHLEMMIKEVENCGTLIQDLDTILFSIFYHDAVYITTKFDNELQSALLFKKRIATTTFPNIDKCFNQILATKDHNLSKELDTNILLDLDLCILGKSTDGYKNYATNIRKEYQVYPYFIYKKGRKKVLQNILSKDRIYKTDLFFERYETKARENITFELNTL